MDELTPDNSFVCEECSRHLMDGNMCVLSCTKYYEGLICIDCASSKYPKELKKAIRERKEKRTSSMLRKEIAEVRKTLADLERELSAAVLREAVSEVKTWRPDLRKMLDS